VQTFTDLRGQARPPTDLPLFDAPATVRTFDSPEFRDVTFYEVEAKSPPPAACRSSGPSMCIEDVLTHAVIA
jgi:hypothetical protein